jgi:hypothetical protein
LKAIRIAGIVAALALACAYLWPSDALYAITIWPPFVWAAVGLALALPGIRRNRNRLQWASIAVWILFWFVLGEERKWLPSRVLQPSTNAVEVVSLNCAGGSIEAAREALASKPVIALLQESPSRPELEKLVREVYGENGDVLVGVDASIVVKGKFVPVNLNFGANNFTVALVETESLGSFLAVSLRLNPPVFRMDYWNPDCWRSYAENRSRRRAEFEKVAEYVKDLAPSRVILGGDFNTPPDRGTFAPFDGWLQAASDDSGYTAINDFPMARIDQVWSKGFKPLRSRAERTSNSDHRIVRVWFEPLFTRG